MAALDCARRIDAAGKGERLSVKCECHFRFVEIGAVGCDRVEKATTDCREVVVRSGADRDLNPVARLVNELGRARIFST